MTKYDSTTHPESIRAIDADRTDFVAACCIGRMPFVVGVEAVIGAARN